VNFVAESRDRTVSNPVAMRGTGQPIEPGVGVVPILQEVGPKRLKVVGTGFYITRYGLVATAKHVVEELQVPNELKLVPGFVLHRASVEILHIRSIRKAHLLKTADVCVLQADNSLRDFPADPLMNLRPTLSTQLPAAGEPLVTFAYPENAILDFNNADHVPELRGDYFQGGFLRFVAQPEHPFLRFPYFESTVELRSGASGGPVFNSDGRIVAINCRGWDFRGSEHEGNHLSYLVPITHLLDLEIDPFMVPPKSWEAAQIAPEKAGQHLTIRQLALYGHILIEPPLEAAPWR
jgi:trypsin-like peptidase